MAMNELLLKVDDLRTHFFSREGVLRAVDGINFEIHRGETLGIVGESGCGKSVTAQSIMRILPKSGRIVSGKVLFHSGETMIDLSRLSRSSSWR